MSIKGLPRASSGALGTARSLSTITDRRRRLLPLPKQLENNLFIQIDKNYCIYYPISK